MSLAAPQIRPARPDDQATVEALHAAALAGLHGHRGGPQLAAGLPRPDELVATLDGPLGASRCLLVGLLDGSVVGMATASLDSAPGSGRLARVDLLFVDVAGRRRGVGALLLAGVRGWARDTGCNGIDAPALPGDRGMKSLFEAAGMRARLLVLHGDL